MAGPACGDAFPYETRCEGLCWAVDLVLPACQDVPSSVGHGDEREHESES